MPAVPEQGLYGVPPPMYGGPGPPPPPWDPETIEGCLWPGGFWYVVPRNGLVAYDASYTNRCEGQTLRFRFAVSIYVTDPERDVPDKHLGSNRHEHVTDEHFWLCGDDVFGPPCFLSVAWSGPEPEFGNVGHWIKRNTAICLPEDPCPWPPYPEKE